MSWTLRRRERTRLAHPRGILAGLYDRLRGREQWLVRAGDDVPLLLVSFPRGADDVAREVEAAWSVTLRGLSPELRSSYEAMLAALPPIVVLLLHPYNACGCLGHHHPPGAESRLARRLSADFGRRVGEIDLAYEGIRQWRPEPLSTLAAGELGTQLETMHFHAAVLGVLLHELEHLAFPNKTEQDVRTRSNRFYSAAMQELAADAGAGYGIASPPPRP